MLKIVVPYTWARDPEDAAVRADGSVDWRGARMAPGDDDPTAVAVGRAIAAAADGCLVGLTIGDGDPSWGPARGLEQTVVVEDAPSLADDAATASVLAAAIRHIGDVDLVVIGDAEPHPGVAGTMAGQLGWPAVLGASTVTWDDGRLVVTRRIEEREQTLSMSTPAVVTVAAVAAEKQPPGMKEVLAARKRPTTRLRLAELTTCPLDRLESRGTRAPDGGNARIFEGPPAETSRQLVAALRTDGVL